MGGILVQQVLISEKNLAKVSKGAKIRNRYNQVPHLTRIPMVLRKELAEPWLKNALQVKQFIAFPQLVSKLKKKI